MSPSLARRERWALCDLALDLGPDAPTLCGQWDAAHLMAHLFVREQRPLGAIGIFVAPLAALADRAMERALADGYPGLVARVRRPRFSPLALGPVDALVNTVEYLVHHEDLRRAQPAWEPRPVEEADLDVVWTAIARMGRMLVRSAGVPVEIERIDTGQVARLRGGDAPVRVSGPVVEIVLFLFGRDQVRELRFTGPDDAVTALRAADRGL